MNWPRIQCLTQDGLASSHVEQVRRLVDAGARWIQLRMKSASEAEVKSVAGEAYSICNGAGCCLILNDHIEIAVELGLDGAHLGSQDMDWKAARALAGEDFVIGGTVNSVEDAERAVQSGVLNYVGVGPYRFTDTKARLAPVLSNEDWQSILSILSGLKAYGIGGVNGADFEALNKLGLDGVAVCSVLYRGGAIEGNFRRLEAAWPQVMRAI